MNDMQYNKEKETQIIEMAQDIESLRRPNEQDEKAFCALVQEYQGCDPSVRITIERVLEKSFGWTNKTERNNFMWVSRIIATLGEYPQTHERFIELAMNCLHYDQRIDGMYNATNKASSNPGHQRLQCKEKSHVMRNLQTLASELKAGINRHEISDAFHTYTDDKHEELLGTLYAKLQFQAFRPELWETIAKTLLSPELKGNRHYVAATAAILQTFMWRVKNILRGRTTTTQILPYLYGPQGKGKSHFVHWLLKPLDGACANSTLRIFVDNGQTHVLRKFPVVFLDELAKGDTACMESMKQMITADVMNGRNMYEQSEQAFILASFIACSNFSLADVIKDFTGSRRYWELPVDNDLVNSDYSTKIDPLDLWTSVDENADAPCNDAAVKDFIRMYQHQQVIKSTVYIWLTDTKQAIFDKKIAVGRLHDRYREWAENSGTLNKIRDVREFGRELSRISKMDDTSLTISSHQSNGTCYRIERDSCGLPDGEDSDDEKAL